MQGSPPPPPTRVELRRADGTTGHPDWPGLRTPQEIKALWAILSDLRCSVFPLPPPMNGLLLRPLAEDYDVLESAMDEFDVLRHSPMLGQLVPLWRADTEGEWWLALMWRTDGDEFGGVAAQ